jgi:hypothetical protein
MKEFISLVYVFFDIIIDITGIRLLVSRFTKEPEMGAKRLKTAFLFFPKILLNDMGFDELRWLKHATWTEMYYGDVQGWIGFRWIDGEKIWRY